MKLKILDRILLMQVLPAQGDFVSLKIIKDLRDKLGFTTKEVKKYKIKTVDNAINWNPKYKETEEDIKLVRVERDLIIENLNKMSEEKKATEQHLYMYEKVKSFHDKLEKKG